MRIAVRRPPKRILFVTSEFGDYVKVGGLGDVSSALPRALSRLHEVRILVPGYRDLLRAAQDLQIIGHLDALAGLPSCDLGRFRTADGLTGYALICPELYERDGTPYGDTSGADWADNDIRFGRLALAGAEIACGGADPRWRPDLIHVNDWTSALAPAYIAWRGQSMPSILTIHNAAYGGVFDRARLEPLGIPQNAFTLDGVEFYGRVSFLKAGISYCSHVTTVSSTYADEITRPEFGCGLDGLLKLRAQEGRLTGIINGIDGSWDPRCDPHLDSPFDIGDWSSRQPNAKAVRAAFGVAVSRGPLFAVISRLVHQKGVDLTIQATETIVRQGGQIVFTGRGEARLEAELTELARRYPGKVGVKIGYEERLARRMYAGSDFLLMPSRFEPCGLTQMYAQRFGSLPVAHQTGGLADTIEDGVTGFLFREASLVSMLNAIYRSFDAFSSSRRLGAMRRAAMKRHFGWQRSAKRYTEVYEHASRSR
jgi:starch synthase